MGFKVVGPVVGVAEIARGPAIRNLPRLRKKYGGRNWRKMKGRAKVELENGKIREAEVHWYEAHGIGRKEWKIKGFVG